MSSADKIFAVLLLTACTVCGLTLSGCEESESTCILSVPAAIVHGRTPKSIERDIVIATVLLKIDATVDGVEITEQCSGAAVSDNRVLTAAHCFKHGTEWDVSLTIPSPDKASSDLCETPFHTLKGTLLKRHPTLDLAVIEVEGRLDATVSAAEEVPSVGEEATVAGYGLDENDRLGTLSFLDTMIVSYQQNLWKVDSGSAGACAGDSGGPMFVYNEVSERYELVGILSVGSALCMGVDYYTDVGSVRAWWEE